MTKILSPQIDVVFKKLFSAKENTDLLQDFLAQILGLAVEELKDIQVMNPELIPDEIEQKFSRLDVRVKIADKNVNIEMQVRNNDDYRSRALCYWSQLFLSDFKAGQPYAELSQTITINIVNFKLFDYEKYHSTFGVIEKDTGEELSEKFRIDFIELPKVSKSIENKNKLIQWLKFLKIRNEGELDMLEQNSLTPAVKKAVGALRRLSADDEMRAIARFREKALCDEGSALATAEKKGLQKGIKKGMQKGLQKGRQEGRREGRREGRLEGRQEGRLEGVKEGRLEERKRFIEKMKEQGFSEEQINSILG